MKKRILAIFVIAAVLGLAIAAFAYNQTNVGITAAASCCKDSCPMKNKDGHHAEHGKDHAKGEGHDCCGDSCPMKAKGGENVNAGGHGCCCCGGDSCPMKKKDGQGAATSATDDSSKNCCDNCDCCKDKAKTEAAGA